MRLSEGGDTNSSTPSGPGKTCIDIVKELGIQLEVSLGIFWVHRHADYIVLAAGIRRVWLTTPSVCFGTCSQLPLAVARSVPIVLTTSLGS